MPVMHIYLYKGEPKEVKKELVRRFANDFQEVAQIAPESLYILFHDTEKEDRGARDTLASEPVKWMKPGQFIPSSPLA